MCNMFNSFLFVSKTRNGKKHGDMENENGNKTSVNLNCRCVYTRFDKGCFGIWSLKHRIQCNAKLLE